MSKKERKLTPAEEKRKAEFEKLCVEMKKKGYAKKDLTVGIAKANIIAFFIMLPFVIVAALVYSAVNPIDGIDFASNGTEKYFLKFLIFIAVYFVFIVLHELIHGLTWGLFAKSHFKSISFGIIWEMVTPYCCCSEPLTKAQYIIGSSMPTLILGFIPAVISVIIGNPWLLTLSVLMIFGGGGDFFIILKMLSYRSRGAETLFYDHPYECGVVVFEKTQ